MTAHTGFFVSGESASGSVGKTFAARRELFSDLGEGTNER